MMKSIFGFKKKKVKDTFIDIDSEIIIYKSKECKLKMHWELKKYL